MNAPQGNANTVLATALATALAQGKEERKAQAAHAVTVSQGDTAKAKAEGAALAAKAAERLAEVTPVAIDIATACFAAEDAAVSMSQLIIVARCSGFSWDELERVDLPKKQFGERSGKGGKMRLVRLLDFTSYRKIKQRINKFVEMGGVLTPDMSAGDLKRATKEGAKAEGSDADVETLSAPGADKPLQFTDKLSVIKAAFAVMREDATMRAAHRAEIAELARMSANDVAKEKADADKADKAAKAKADADAKAKARADAAAKRAAEDAAKLAAEYAAQGLTKAAA
jgi:hypothetical protein